jgi:hypothetical protein
MALSAAEIRNRDLMDAATNLSEARKQAKDNSIPFSRRVDVLSDAVFEYDEAYRAYTNPFGVEKTVDARWPNVK